MWEDDQMKDYAYLRVSSDGQADMGFGLDLQRERITAYAKALGFEIADDCWIVDDGYTGTNLDRPGLQSLLGLVASGKVRKVVVYKIDRLSRSQRRLLEVIEDHLDKNGVAFVSVMEQFDTSTPFGRACLGMSQRVNGQTIVSRNSTLTMGVGRS
jgi:site-specific DNA recombinase